MKSRLILEDKEANLRRTKRFPFIFQTQGKGNDTEPLGIFVYFIRSIFFGKN